MALHATLRIFVVIKRCDRTCRSSPMKRGTERSLLTILSAKSEKESIG
jgi:hypothetical protein